MTPEHETALDVVRRHEADARLSRRSGQLISAWAYEELVAAVKLDADRLRKLADFGLWCLREARTDGGGDLDGFALQEKAEETGLLVHVTVTEPCCDNCRCAEYYGEFPADCLREADWCERKAAE